MILALESSCDETAVAVFDPARGLVGEWVHSQITLHEAYGGVVPDLASREHLSHFGPLLARALAAVPAERITQIAVTNGPGLAACLAMGLAAAKSLGLAWGVPVVGVNHLRAHAFSPFIALQAAGPADFAEGFEKLLPHLGLLVSGGNTALFSIDELRCITLLASTMDDAAGEALDKGAKLLGLGYPGGPQVEKLAATGNAAAFEFPKAVAQRSSLEFSFSGLKTSLRYQLQKMAPADIERRKADLCASYQAAVFNALVRKSGLALERNFVGRDHRIPPKSDVAAAARRGAETPPYSEASNAYRSFGLSGGVANNQTLQAELAKVAQAQNLPFFRALPQHTGDNAGMIAFAAWMERETGGVSEAGLSLGIAPSLPLAAG
ncbi:tRNA (adenosine(37)-N6)-threonylcarbamoyltransferase complex transferase subunit TsaD [Opitutus sp. GAS368]|uniref:tRNA (adenosine(37)-N6)-threonylcarbamoyltransferase complex transferase subunit TsaD n=1 Tax=Opitutus sp. GAS368 TaxID=1882749 RepID=UPI0008798BC6|nr:tRNA (adenosine(37)-N6)-threonylcarbamoyltransferase complex transferase subunit TsaD [Opitutus sp. GAS368]SDR66789.1 O-sialoglycoprotein endopeptidase [Opitutus sp. GAS368]